MMKMYETQIKKIDESLETLHPDLQYDLKTTQDRSLENYFDMNFIYFFTNFIFHQIKRRYSCNLQVEHGLRC